MYLVVLYVLFLLTSFAVKLNLVFCISLFSSITFPQNAGSPQSKQYTILRTLDPQRHLVIDSVYNLPENVSSDLYFSSSCEQFLSIHAHKPSKVFIKLWNLNLLLFDNSGIIFENSSIEFSALLKISLAIREAEKSPIESSLFDSLLSSFNIKASISSVLISPKLSSTIFSITDSFFILLTELFLGGSEIISKVSLSMPKKSSKN